LNSLLISSIIGAGAGIIGTGLGGAVVFVLRKPSSRFLSTLLSFSAGLMISVVCFDLLPESFEIGSLAWGILGIILGTGMILLFEAMLTSYSSKKLKRRSNTFVQTGILLGVGIAMHNFPEGLAIGSGFTALKSYGIGLSIVIALHDIPEGVAMATPMSIGGVNKFKIFLYSILAGVPTGLGALIGYMLGEISPIMISICLGFAGGAMLYITCSELIPQSRNLHKGRISTIGLIIGIITGILISSAI
jgi:ZIP family zinc transporter